MADANINIEIRFVVRKEHNLCKCRACGDLVCGDSYSLLAETKFNDNISLSYINEVLCQSCYDLIKDNVECLF